MTARDVFLAVLVAVAWGLGFVFTRMAVEEISTTLFTFLRFVVAALPCLVLARPKISLKLLFGIATLLVSQFLAQTYGMAHGVPAGLTAVIVQSQAIFTIIFAALLCDEKPTRAQVVGIVVAMFGLLLICFTVGYDFNALAFILTMTAPISFAFGNLLLRQARNVAMLDLSVWVSLVTLPPLALVVIGEGAAANWQAATHLSLRTIGCLLFVSLAGTVFGYWTWGRLLHRYTAAQVVPFALLVPFAGAGASSLVYGEVFGPMRLAGVLIVIAGIAVMLLLGRVRPTPAAGA